MLFGRDERRIELEEIETGKDGRFELLFHDGAAGTARVGAFPSGSRFNDCGATTGQIDTMPAFA